MIRARFTVLSRDYRPVIWPIKHPYWCSGTTGRSSILIAYADDLNELKDNWPDAEDITWEHQDEYTFTDRFPKPEWLGKVN